MAERLESQARQQPGLASFVSRTQTAPSRERRRVGAAVHRRVAHRRGAGRSLAPPGIEVKIPGRRRPLRIEHVVLDFNGTLAVDGRLIRGVAPRLRALAAHAGVVVLTADTFGTVRRALAHLPVTVRVVRGGAEKRRGVEALGGKTVAAVGNGANDVPMLRAAGLAIAVLGDEGTAGPLLSAATIVMGSITCALDLLLRPDRLVATLRA